MGTGRSHRGSCRSLLGAARGVAIAAMMPGACGGSVSPTGGDSPEASPARDAPPSAPQATEAGVEGNAPDDAARPLPSVLECEGEGGSVAIALPCQLGMGPVFEMECRTDPPGLLSA